jgi:hypothetical protein
VPGYDVPVLNEREVRAAAGILFLFAVMTFASAWFVGNFRPTKIFVIAFLIDFTIRLFVNPRYAPSMIAARFAVRGQAPEWVGAPQKRFAWAIGWVLALAMLWLIVINNVIGPINMLVCATCLTLMFFESPSASASAARSTTPCPAARRSIARAAVAKCSRRIRARESAPAARRSWRPSSS